MKKKKIYIFSSTNRAAIYGIGTYIDQLKICLKKNNIEFELVRLYTEEIEVSVTEKEDYRQIAIPAIISEKENSTQYYSRNVAYLLREFIPEEDDEYDRIFHLNLMTNIHIVEQLKKMFKCKIILTIHYTLWSFDLLGNYDKLKELLNEKTNKLKTSDKIIVEGFREDVEMIKKCDSFICIAQHTLDTFSELGKVERSKSRIINNGLEDVFKKKSERELNQIRKKYKIDKDTKIIFFAGRLDTVKGVKFLIQAFKNVFVRYPDSLLVIAGDGDFPGLLKEAEEYWTKIIFTGRLKKEILYEFYQIADVGVICSIHEEFGYVGTEMMMHQLSVVATHTGGLVEMIEDNISGLKVPVRTNKDERFIRGKDIAEKICFLLDHPLRANEIAENGRQRYLDRYNLDTFHEKMAALYNEII